MNLVQTPCSERIQGSFPYVTLSTVITFLALHLESVYLINENGKKKHDMIFKCLLEKTIFTHLTAEAW